MTKNCTKCGKEYSATTEYFNKNKGGRYGVGSWCKKCVSIYGIIHNRSEKRRISSVLYRKNHPEKIKESQKRYATTIKGQQQRKNNGLKSKHNITLEQYNKMFAAQNGVCAICHRPETAKNRFGVRQLSVDHNHNTDKIRGLLCDRCNRMIGFARENITTLLNAGIYLEEYK